MPASGLPLLYFGFAHLCLLGAFAALAVRPDLPGAFFHHPRMMALVHLVTLGWISASILGAFYIVAPLALRMPLAPGPADRVAFASYAAGVAGMVQRFWTGDYEVMAWAAVLVLLAIGHVAVRAWAGLRRAPVPGPVKLHVALAFANVLGAGLLGIAAGVDRVFGVFGWPPLSVAFAHAHLATVGWALMMVVGLSYRLVPMILPAAMPAGRSMAWSAVLLQAGVLLLTVALLGIGWSAAGALLIVAGIASFVVHVRRMLARRLPPPAALPQPDWATWQTRVAFGWLLVAVVTGVLLTLPLPLPWVITLGWVYGTAGLVGFLAQVVVGMQGRLLPLHGWYRLFEAAGHRPPGRSAHTLAVPALALASLVTWALGIPLLATGLACGILAAIAGGSVLLCAGVAVNALQTLEIATGQRAS